MMNSIDNREPMTWSMDRWANLLTMSISYRQMAGISSEALLHNPKLLQEMVYSEDLPLFNEHMDKLCSGQTSHIEYRILVSTNMIKWVQSIGIPILDNKHEIDRIKGVVLDLTEQRAAQKQLESEHSSLHAMLQTVDVSIWSYDMASQKILFMSDAIMTITGYPIERFKDIRTWIDMTHHDDRFYCEKITTNLRQGKPDFSEYRIIHATGETRWIQVRIIPSLDEFGFVVRLDGAATDITGRKVMEEALSRSEQRYKSLFEYNSDVVCELDLQGNVLAINPAAENITGEKPIDVEEGLPLMDVFSQEHIHSMTANFERALQGYSEHYHVSSHHKNGRTVYWDMKNIPIYVDDNIVGVYAIAKDITARRKIEKELRESEERYRSLVELSPVAIAVYKDNEITYINPAGAQMLGVVFKGDSGAINIMDWIHPDHREDARERLNYTLLNGYSPPRECQLIRSDGQILDVSLMSIYDSRFSSIQFMFDDISARKQAERALVESEEFNRRDRKEAELDRQRTEQIIRDSEERHFRLQTSLDRFSHDLFGVMKVSQLERRLLKEIKDVLMVSKVSLLETEQNHDRLCEMIETNQGYTLKIGEVRGMSYILRLDEKPKTLEITSTRVWLVTIIRYVSVLFENFLLIEDLSKEVRETASMQAAPTWLIRFLFQLSENERKHLAQDLHDAALQEQIIWYRKLDILLADESLSGELKTQLEEIAQGLLDVIYQIRITCNELRPPMLIEEGLTSSLEALFDFTQLRTNYRIEFDAEHFNLTLDDDLLTGLYRIVQELLANAAKHSSATVVRILLSSNNNYLRLEYEDNGVGMERIMIEDSFESMGIYGIKGRVRSMEGTIEFRSSQNKGLAITIFIPMDI